MNPQSQPQPPTSQTPQAQTPPPQTPLPQDKPKPKSKMLFLLLGVLIILIALGITGYMTFMANPTPTQEEETEATPTIQPEISLTQTPSTTSAEISNWQTYTSEKLDSVSLEPYSLSYPPDWTAESQRDEATDTLVLSHGEYRISIYQAPVGGGICVFEGSMPEGPANDLRDTEFVSVETQIGEFRRYPVVIADQVSEMVVFNFCSLNEDNQFVSPTSVGGVVYEVPKSYDNTTLSQMDRIIRTLTHTTSTH